jgi:hypothetical protein
MCSGIHDCDVFSATRTIAISIDMTLLTPDRFESGHDAPR